MDTTYLTNRIEDDQVPDTLLKITWDPPSNKFNPRSHQSEIIEGMVSKPVLAVWSDCGSGKTVSTLMAITRLYLDLEFQGAIIVAPRLSCDLTWPDEINQWGFCNWMRVADLRTEDGQATWAKGSADIYLINYDRLDRLPRLFETRNSASLIVFDEITKLKNPQSNRAKAWNGTHLVAHRDNSLRKHFKRVYGLTGSPAANHLSDLFGQFLALDAGERLGRFQTNFQNLYFEKDFTGYKLTPRPGAEERIRDLISDITLSIPLPPGIGPCPIVTEDVDVILTPEVKRIYKAAQKEFLISLKNVEIPALTIATLLDKLQQLTSGCVYQKGQDGVNISHNAHTAKLDALKKIMAEKRNVLVFFKYKSERHRLLEYFPEAQELSPKTVPLWNKKKIKMLIAHPASAGHSLNLQHGGSEIVWFSLCHSGELYLQANARLQRPGQTTPVRVRRLLCPGTIDDAIAESLRKKQKTNDTMRNIVRILKKLFK